jgi:putative SOS response-associated peptidase YedK
MAAALLLHLGDGELRDMKEAGNVDAQQVITTTPNALCAALHDRMPVVLKADTWPQWLGEAAEPKRLKALLAPYPTEEMVAWPVSPRVGNVKNDDASLVEPIVGTG